MKTIKMISTIFFMPNIFGLCADTLSFYGILFVIIVLVISLFSFEKMWLSQNNGNFFPGDKKYCVIDSRECNRREKQGKNMEYLAQN